ncbi:MAG: tRNA (adenosine(37)-N6)-threonylcarbamoyltransferase complex ATPase subunit type 1 TsaE [Muribaculaceae bacterium]|nr:tRNA (adenosine(37)-N6)-threonylcarbamoyltransferase complex ATPase subunit type 1 TsaE [Muribaculaceae bacterium]
MTISIANESALDQAALNLLEALGESKHIALRGPMGAGKTTLTAALCRALGVSNEVNSPTFSIINEYQDKTGNPVFHFDFYRIESEREGAELGLDEYFDSGALCIMEWPENVETLLPDDITTVAITVNPDSSRTLTISDGFSAS